MAEPLILEGHLYLPPSDPELPADIYIDGRMLDVALWEWQGKSVNEAVSVPKVRITVEVVE